MTTPILMNTIRNLAFIAAGILIGTGLTYFATQNAQPAFEAPPAGAAASSSSVAPTLPAMRDFSTAPSQPEKADRVAPSGAPALRDQQVPVGSLPSPNAGAVALASQPTAPAAAPSRAGGQGNSGSAQAARARLTVQAPDHSLTLEIDPDVRIPAAMLESESPLPPAIAAAKDGITREFQREVLAAAAQPDTSQTLDETWVAARGRADARLRTLFGDDAFNAWQMHAAREALKGAGAKRP